MGCQKISWFTCKLVSCNLPKFLVKRSALNTVNFITEQDSEFHMSRVCQVTGKKPMSGNNVSHSQRKTKRRFLPNLNWHRIWVPSENRFVRMLLSNQGLRIIDKKGIEAVLADLDKKREASLIKGD